MTTQYDFYDKKVIKELRYNWHQVIDGNDAGENWHHATVGENNVVAIHEHEAHGEGDKWFFDIVYSDKGTERIFNPNRVIYNQ